MSLTVYLAGPYRARADLLRCADELASIGYKVTSRWLAGGHEGQPDAATDAPIEDRRRWAREDCQDVTAAQILVAFTAKAAWALGGETVPPPPSFGASGGRHIETGYALGTDRQIVLVGEPENVFHWLPEVVRVADWHEGVLWLDRHLVEYEGNRPVAS